MPNYLDLMHFSSKLIPGVGFESAPGSSNAGQKKKRQKKEPTVVAPKQQKIDYEQLGAAFATASQADTDLAAAAKTEAAAATSLAESRRIEVLANSLDRFPVGNPIRAAMEAELKLLLQMP